MASSEYRRRPGDVIIRRMRLEPERVVLPTRRRPRQPPPPALVLAVLYVVGMAVGAAVLALPAASATGEWTSLRVAFFTATSALTLTGLVLEDTGTYWSGLGQAVILLLIQVGGLGFMTGASLVFALLRRRISLRERLLVREAVGAFAIGEAVQLTRRIALTMITVEAVGAALLFVRFRQERPLGEALWFSVFHAVSALNNAGFDLTGGFQSLTAYKTDPLVVLTVAALVIVGSTSYMTLEDLARQRSFQRLSLDSKLVVTSAVAVWVVGLIAMLAMEWGNLATFGPLTWPEKTMDALFLSVTARTAGFATVDTGGLTEPSLFILCVLMFIGGASASAAGGIRLNTFTVLAVAILATAAGRQQVHIFRRAIPPELINRALAIALLSLAFVVIATTLLAIIEQAPLVPALFEVVSAFGTVGLSTGMTPGLSDWGSWIVALTMIVGRLGPLTLAVLLANRLTAARLRYAEELVRVG